MGLTQACYRDVSSGRNPCSIGSYANNPQHLISKKTATDGRQQILLVEFAAKYRAEAETWSILPLVGF